METKRQRWRQRERIDLVFRNEREGGLLMFLSEFDGRREIRPVVLGGELCLHRLNLAFDVIHAERNRGKGRNKDRKGERHKDRKGDKDIETKRKRGGLT